MLSAPSPEPPETEVTVNEVCENGYVLLEALNTGADIAFWIDLVTEKLGLDP